MSNLISKTALIDRLRCLDDSTYRQCMKVIVPIPPVGLAEMDDYKKGWEAGRSALIKELWRDE